jgi:hypothetical protein
MVLVVTVATCPLRLQKTDHEQFDTGNNQAAVENSIFVDQNTPSHGLNLRN